MTRGWTVWVLMGVLAVAGCSSTQREATREERIARTQTALEMVFVADFAATEAVRLVDECDRIPDSLFGFSIVDPDGAELFDGYEAARRAARRGSTVVDIVSRACTQEAYEFIKTLENI